MDIYLKVTAGILITAILSLVLSKYSADISLLLTVCVCSMVILTSSAFVMPVLDFARRLAEIGQLNFDMLEVLQKVVGIGLVSQIAGFICTDAGNQTLAKALQIITTAVLLCVSVPLFDEILSLVEIVLGEL